MSDDRKFMWHDAWNCPEGCSHGHSFKDITKHLSTEDTVAINALEVGGFYVSDDGYTDVSREE